MPDKDHLIFTAIGPDRVGLVQRIAAFISRHDCNIEDSKMAVFCGEFAVIVLIALGIAVINIDPPTVLFGLFVAYGLSGYVVYAWRKAKGQPVSVISVSTEEPDERGLHK